MKLLQIYLSATFMALASIAPSLSEGASAELPADRPVTLQECIDYALAHHNSVLAADRDLEAGYAGLRRARTGRLPRVTIGSDFSKSGYEGGQVGTGFRRVGTFSSEQTVVGLSETVFDGGRTRTAIRQASASARVSDANLELARQERVLVVTQAYFNALLTKRLADIAGQSVEESERQRELIQARIDAGDAARVDIYPVDVQLANAKLNRLRADNDVRVAANALRNAVGLDRGPELRPADVEEPSFRIPSLEESLSAALNDRPEVARQAAELDSAGAALSLAKSQIVPVPTASLNYDRGLAGTGYDSQWSVGFGLSMNLFDAGAARAEVDGSRARVDSLTLREDQLRKDVSAEVEEAHLNLTNALERLAASKANVNLAQTNLEVARVKYEQGLAIPLEIVSAQVSYSDAQASNAQALYDCYIERARLDKVIGRRGFRS